MVLYGGVSAIPPYPIQGAITTVMTKSGGLPGKLTVISTLGLMVWLVLHSANRIQKCLGRVGIKVMVRMMGLILTSMTVQMVINGIKGAFGL